jgi:hypothetical protein
MEGRFFFRQSGSGIIDHSSVRYRMKRQTESERGEQPFFHSAFYSVFSSIPEIDVIKVGMDD